MGSPTIFAGRRTKTLTSDGLLLRSKATIDNDGPINPIANGHFEIEVSPWEAYANAAQATPVTGEGGTPNITFVRSTSSPLFGLASGLLTKQASNRQGEGISYTATTPAGWQSKVIKATFDCEMSAGYDASAETVDVFIYDVTNGALLTALHSSKQRIGTLKQEISCSFTNSSTATSLRLVIHISGTGTTAWTMKIGNVKIEKVAEGETLTMNSTNQGADRVKNKDFEDSSTAIVDSSDPTKKIIHSAGGTTGTATTLVAAQTANRTLNYPDATDTLVGKSTADVFTNKDIDGGTASDTTRITVPKNTTVNLDALTRKEGTVVYDTDLDVFKGDNGSSLQTFATGITDNPDTVNNCTVAPSVAANALTIALKTRAGADASVSDYITIPFRSATTTSGLYTLVNVTAALSTVISSGSTAGHDSAVTTALFVYAINNAGTAELAWSSSLFDDGAIVSTTAEGGAGAADSATIMYSTTARTNVACKLLGRLFSTQATAGTWATAPVVSSSVLVRRDIFPARLDDVTATRMGMKTYAHGTNYNQGNAPTVTLSSGGGTLTTVDQGDFIPYQMQDGTWRMKFNLAGTISSVSRTSIVIAIAGVSFLATGGDGQTCSFSGYGNGNEYNVFVGATAGAVQVTFAAGTVGTEFIFAGDVKLASKPTWAY